MSDFDKEAEREKLRKKFARDKEKRAHTQRMSELLLKGATMTNKHCDQCSDPLFRHNGQTFCPSCQADDSDTSAQQSTDSSTHAEPANKSTAAQADSPESHSASQRPPTGDPAADQTPATSSPTANVPSDRPASSDSTRRRQASIDPSTEGLTPARQSLERTITRFCRRAEATDDPRQARELLAAAHEAAATLSELQ